MREKDKVKKMMDTLYKKAIGYVVEEVVEEYGGAEKDGELLKRKVTQKPIPPDVLALKTYIELNGSANELAEYSDEQLEMEKQRLITEIKNKK